VPQTSASVSPDTLRALLADQGLTELQGSLEQRDRHVALTDVEPIRKLLWKAHWRRGA